MNNFQCAATYIAGVLVVLIMATCEYKVAENFHENGCTNIHIPQQGVYPDCSRSPASTLKGGDL